MNDRSIDETVKKSAEAGRNGDHDASRAATTASADAGKVGEQVSASGADVFRQGADTARETLYSGLNTAVQGLQRMTDQFTQVLGFEGPHSEELARRSSQNLEAVSQASAVLSRGAREVSQEWVGLVQERLQKNIEGLNRLASCRSVQDLLTTQGDLVRDGLQHVIDVNKRVAELSVRTAEEATRTIQATSVAVRSSRAA